MGLILSLSARLSRRPPRANAGCSRLPIWTRFSPIPPPISRHYAARSAGRSGSLSFGCKTIGFDPEGSLSMNSPTPPRLRRRAALGHRLRRMREQGLKPPIPSKTRDDGSTAKSNAVIDCGWGRLLFGQTFESPMALIEAMRAEGPERRDIAFYIRDPHVAIAAAPHEVFLDPSHTYRLDLSTYRASRRKPRGFFIRRLTSETDADAINRLYLARSMVPVVHEFFWSRRDSRAITYFVA